MDLAQRVRRYRENRGLKRSELADALGVAPSAVWSWEKGVYRPSAERQAQLAAFFDVGLQTFLFGALPSNDTGPEAA